jgi:hypothetical protein
MSGYNNVLNNLPKYKHDLVEALVMGSDFPFSNVISGSIALQAARDENDPLLGLFERRDFRDVAKIMQLQVQRFGAIDTELFWSVIAYVAAHGRIGEASSLAELARRSAVHVSHIPDDATFMGWHHLHAEYFKDALHYFDSLVPRGVNEYDADQLSGIFTAALEWSGLQGKGWGVALNQRTNFISIAKREKKILIGSSRVRLADRRLVGLLIHELYIHAMWVEHHEEERRDTSVEEGIGTLMEQLTLTTFYPLRMYRFLAICFAAGVDGVVRDMRQTYELLVEVRRVLSLNDDTDTIRRFVAKEVVRVFRNLPPDVLGLVYIRDKHYLEHNAAIWGTLTEGEPTMKRFVSLVAPWEVT